MYSVRPPLASPRGSQKSAIAEKIEVEKDRETKTASVISDNSGKSTGKGQG